MMIQDHLYPRLCNGEATKPHCLGNSVCRGAVQPLRNARCHLMCEGTKPVSEHTSQFQHLTLIWRCLMTHGMKKTKSFVTTGWQFWVFVPLEQSAINIVYLERDWHLWWTDLIQWNEIHKEQWPFYTSASFCFSCKAFLFT